MKSVKFKHFNGEGFFMFHNAAAMTIAIQFVDIKAIYLECLDDPMINKIFPNKFSAIAHAKKFGIKSLFPLVIYPLNQPVQFLWILQVLEGISSSSDAVIPEQKVLQLVESLARWKEFFSTSSFKGNIFHSGDFTSHLEKYVQKLMNLHPLLADAVEAVLYVKAIKDDFQRLDIYNLENILEIYNASKNQKWSANEKNVRF